MRNLKIQEGHLGFLTGFHHRFEQLSPYLHGQKRTWRLEFIDAIGSLSWRDGVTRTQQYLTPFIPVRMSTFISRWKSYILLMFLAISVNLFVYLFPDAGFFLSSLFCLFVFVILKSIPPVAPVININTFPTLSGSISLPLHRRILERQRREVVHRVLSYLATNRFTVKIENVPSALSSKDIYDADVAVQENPQSADEPCGPPEGGGHDLEISRSGCSACGRFFKT